MAWRFRKQWGPQVLEPRVASLALFTCRILESRIEGTAVWLDLAMPGVRFVQTSSLAGLVRPGFGL